ncbi:unnamed protein product [Phytophthora fragariaefolia]|uniref:Unnamed protein product n=1 Tax=Phytophthora fragariaefolia TaxID=1490495 RepID=A0A9W6X5C9_9STRA|nr:unnamed protein product [Phytophthora fragariaefolia]
MDNHVDSVSRLDEDTEEVNSPAGCESYTMEKIDASAMLPPTTNLKGKRPHRDETPSKEKRLEQGANKPRPKRTGLVFAKRSPHKGESNRNRCWMLRSKWRELFVMAEMEETTSLKAKDVIEHNVAEGAKPVNTMWEYALKSDQQGYEIRFKALVVPLGNYQRPCTDLHETFTPIAKTSSFEC